MRREKMWWEEGRLYIRGEKKKIEETSSEREGN